MHSGDDVCDNRWRHVILDSIFHKLVVVGFITSVNFVVFVAECIFAVAKTIVTALVGGRLECCNSLYHNIALKDILKFQRRKGNYPVSSFLSLSTTS